MRFAIMRTGLALLAGATATVVVVLAAAALPVWQAAALLAVTAACAALGWELWQSRRRLMAEHAAHLAKSLYLANMSHELRTPLNAIIGFADLMRLELAGPLGSPKYAEYLGDIHETATHLLDLINDVLDLSRIEAGRLELNEAAVNVAAALACCNRLLRERARQAGVGLRFDAAPGLPDLHCDGAKLRQILLNLVTNAVKFTPRGGRVLVTARLTGGGMELAVADTGTGIAAKDIPRVLTPFVRAASACAAQAEGSGLGLPLAKRLVELHGGRLTLDSEPGKGTRVTVVLPPTRILPMPAATRLDLADQPVAA